MGWLANIFKSKELIYLEQLHIETKKILEVDLTNKDSQIKELQESLKERIKKIESLQNEILNLKEHILKKEFEIKTLQIQNPNKKEIVSNNIINEELKTSNQNNLTAKEEEVYNTWKDAISLNPKIKQKDIAFKLKMNPLNFNNQLNRARHKLKEL